MQLPIDILKLILAPFQGTEESLFMSLVCKKWNKLITPASTLSSIAGHYAEIGSLSALQLLKQWTARYNRLLSLLIPRITHKIFIKQAGDAVMAGAAKGGHKEIIKWANTTEPRKISGYKVYPQEFCPLVEISCENAALYGHLDLLKWLKTLGTPWECDILAKAVEGGHWDIIQWLHYNGQKLSRLNWEQIAKKFNFKITSFMINLGLNVPRSAIFTAIRAGNLAMLKALPVNLTVGDYSSEAAYNGQFEVLKWLILEKNCAWGRAAEYAAFQGNLEMLEWAIANGCPVRRTISYQAAEGGKIDILKWLKAKNIAFDVDVCIAAASKGHFDCLLWLVENGASLDNMDESYGEAAVKAKSLKMLKWLKKYAWLENGSEIADLAAGNGDLEILYWLCKHNRKPTKKAWKKALENKHFHILKWLQTNFPIKLSWNLVTDADLESIKWLYRKGLQINNDLVEEAARHGRIDVMKWIRDRGYPWSSSTTEVAASYGQLKFLKWIRKYGCPWSKSTALFAAENGQLEVVRYAIKHNCPYNMVEMYDRMNNGHTTNFDEILKLFNKKRISYHFVFIYIFYLACLSELIEMTGSLIM